MCIVKIHTQTENTYPVCSLHCTLGAGTKPYSASCLRLLLSGRWPIEKKTEVFLSVRKGRLPLYQQFCLHSGGGHTASVHHQCIPRHFHETGNEPYHEPDCKTGSVKRWKLHGRDGGKDNTFQWGLHGGEYLPAVQPVFWQNWISGGLWWYLPDTDVRGTVPAHSPAYHADQFP